MHQRKALSKEGFYNLLLIGEDAEDVHDCSSPSVLQEGENHLEGLALHVAEAATPHIEQVGLYSR